MVEPNESDPTRSALFSLRGRPGSLYRTLHVKFRGCVIQFGFLIDDDGLKDASDLVHALGDLWDEAVTEMGVVDAMRDIDSELDELLGGDDSDE